MSGLIKVTDLGDRVRLQNGGNPTIGVVFDGKFFMSQQDAAKKAGVTPAALSEKLRMGRQVKDRETRFATIEDVKKNLPADKIALATKLKKDGKVTNKKREAAIKREAKKKQQAKPDEQSDLQPLLEGVRWSDGRVTLVMLGTDFEWKLETEEDIPWVWQGRVSWLN